MNIKKKNALFGRYPSCDLLNNALRFIRNGNVDEGFCLADAIKHDSGWYENKFRPGWKTDGRHESCPLVHISPHGRLIDGDVLEEKAIERSEKRGEMVNVLDNVITAYDISTAPTIIEAEEK